MLKEKLIIFRNLVASIRQIYQGEEIDCDLFPAISHIQQKTENDLWDLPNTLLVLPVLNDAPTNFDIGCLTKGLITDCDVCLPELKKTVKMLPLPLLNIKQIVRALKENCPKFPVYKMYRTLTQKCSKRFILSDIKQEKKDEIKVEEPITKRKRGRPKKKKKIIDDNSIVIDVEVSDITQSEKVEMSAFSVAMWTDKYKLQSSEEIIGNNSSVVELKNWLSGWVEYSIEQRTTKTKRRRINSDSTDDFCSDNNTRDTDVEPINTMILLGPCSSGKTSTVYALCNELNINVIELNASTKRPGKRILQELQEATKSYHVKNTDATTVGSFFQKVNTNNSEENVSKKEMTLLLVEDADIVFDDQDEGFISALGSLVTSSKRPIVITSSDANCAHLQKFLAQHKVIKFGTLPSKILGTWLEILCLVEGIQVDRTEVSKLLDWNKGDIRKTILQLQFWAQSGGDHLNNSNKHSFLNVLQLNKSPRRVSLDSAITIDEDSNLFCMSFEPAENEINSVDTGKIHSTCVDCFISFLEKDKVQFQLPYPTNLEVFWWNLPNIYDIKTTVEITSLPNRELSENHVGTPELFSTQDQMITKKSNKEEMQSIGDMLDLVCFTDIVHKKVNLECDFQPCTEYWKIGPVNSLSLEQNLQPYKETDETSLQITHWLIENGVKQYRDICNKKIDKITYDMAVPVVEDLRWRKKHHKTMEGLSDAVAFPSQIDKKSLCADYQSILRTICRSEKIRFMANEKRKNRFYHYLKGLNVDLTDSMYDIVCNTLAKF